MRFIAACLACLTLPLAAQQARPLPDQDAFLREVRKHLQPDEVRQSEYAYVETRRQIKLDGKGRAQGESVKVFESYPGLPGKGRWERLMSEDGKPVSASDLDKKDKKRQEEAVDFSRRLERQGSEVRAELARERAKRRRDNDQMVDDAFRVFDVKMIGRDTIEGHETITLSMTPRLKVKTNSRIGGMLRHFQGRAWISEADHDLVKLEVEAIDDLSIGLGLLARIHKGTHLAFQRRKVGGDEWLPLSATYTASARVLLLRRMRIQGISEFSSYRKFGVDTSTTYSIPPEP